jgi:hypothetical protein
MLLLRDASDQPQSFGRHLDSGQVTVGENHGEQLDLVLVRQVVIEEQDLFTAHPAEAAPGVVADLAHQTLAAHTDADRFDCILEFGDQRSETRGARAGTLRRCCRTTSTATIRPPRSHTTLTAPLTAGCAHRVALVSGRRAEVKKARGPTEGRVA